MRNNLRRLTARGILERRRDPEFPGPVTYQLAPGGRDLYKVIQILQNWLLDSPGGPQSLGEPGAKSSVKALVDGWNSGIVRAIASKPLSLTQLSRLISSLNYPTLERRLGALRISDLIRSCPGRGRGRPYTVSPWLRRAIGPLAASARWERRYLSSESPPIGRIDIEAAFLLVLPVISLPAGLTGVVQFAAELGKVDDATRMAGTTTHVVDGVIESCSTRLTGAVDAWVSGPAAAWIAAAVESDFRGLEVNGDRALAQPLIAGLHEALFTAPRSEPIRDSAAVSLA
jgi:DNA-binding HxlR family transcriptional regulator